MLAENATAQRRVLRLLCTVPLPLHVIARALHISEGAANGTLHRLVRAGYVAVTQHYRWTTGRYVNVYFATRYGLDQSKEIA